MWNSKGSLEHAGGSFGICRAGGLAAAAASAQPQAADSSDLEGFVEELEDVLNVRVMARKKGS